MRAVVQCATDQNQYCAYAAIFCPIYWYALGKMNILALNCFELSHMAFAVNMYKKGTILRRQSRDQSSHENWVLIAEDEIGNLHY